MNRLNLCIKQGDEWVPVGPDNPLPIAVDAAAAQPAAAVADLPEKPTVAATAATVNELLASLRAAGLLAI